MSNGFLVHGSVRSFLSPVAHLTLVRSVVSALLPMQTGILMKLLRRYPSGFGLACGEDWPSSLRRPLTISAFVPAQAVQAPWIAYSRSMEGAICSQQYRDANALDRMTGIYF